MIGNPPARPPAMLNGNAVRCPECNSLCIDAIEYDGDARECWETCRCTACGATWKNLYTLTGQVRIE